MPAPRTADGARGVRVFVDGIPKNNAGGSSAGFHQHQSLGRREHRSPARTVVSAVWQSGGRRGEHHNPIRRTSTGVRIQPGPGFLRVLADPSWGAAVRPGKDDSTISVRHSRTCSTASGSIPIKSAAASPGKFGMTIDDRSTLSIITGYDNQTQGLPGKLTAGEMAARPAAGQPGRRGARRECLWHSTNSARGRVPAPASRGHNSKPLATTRREVSIPLPRDPSFQSEFRESGRNWTPCRAEVVRYACPVDHRARLPEHAYQERKLPPRQLPARRSDDCGRPKSLDDRRPVCTRGRRTGCAGFRQRRATFDRIMFSTENLTVRWTAGPRSCPSISPRVSGSLSG